MFENFDEIYIDIDCEFIMINRQFLINKKSNYVAYVIKINSIKINKIKSTSLFSSKKIVLNFIIFDEIDNDTIKINFIRYVYIVDNLKIKLFINNDIFESKNMMFHINKNKFIIKNYDNFITSLHITFRKNERVCYEQFILLIKYISINFDSIRHVFDLTAHTIYNFVNF